jgi:hypothetical protein
LVVVIGVAFLYSYSLTPLPANPYGRTIYDVHTTLSVPPDSSLSILVGGDQRIPGASFIVITAGVLNDKPGSDIPEDAYFRLERAGSTLDEGIGSGLSLNFETSAATESQDNPQLHIRNDHLFPLDVEYRAFVVRPPTVWEKFSTFAGGVIIAAVLAAIWPLYTLTIGRREGERSA